MSIKYDVITFGSATLDVFLTSKAFRAVKTSTVASGLGECFAHGSKIEVDGVYFDVGGGGANTAVAFSRLGFRSAVVTRVGADVAGATVINQLEQSSVDTRFVSLDKRQATCYSTVLLSSDGERTILVYRGASRAFQPSLIPWNTLRAAWFYVATLAGDVALLRRVFRRAKQAGAQVAWNPGSLDIGKGWDQLLPFIRRCEYMQLNREEAAQLTHQSRERIDLIARTFQGAHVPLLVITDGPAGAYIVFGKELWFVPAVPHKTVNATGAGDAFGSGFVAGFMHTRGDSPRSRFGLSRGKAGEAGWQYAVKLGMLNSAGVVSEMGAQHGLLKRWPSQARLKKIVIRRI